LGAYTRQESWDCTKRPDAISAAGRCPHSYSCLSFSRGAGIATEAIKGHYELRALRLGSCHRRSRLPICAGVCIWCHVVTGKREPVGIGLDPCGPYPDRQFPTIFLMCFRSRRPGARTLGGPGDAFIRNARSEIVPKLSRCTCGHGFIRMGAPCGCNTFRHPGEVVATQHFRVHRVTHQRARVCGGRQDFLRDVPPTGMAASRSAAARSSSEAPPSVGTGAWGPALS